MDALLMVFFMSTLLGKVHSLKCIKCFPEMSLNCTKSEMDCPSGECVSLGVTTYTEGMKVNHINMKFCTAPGQCPSGSINYGTAVSSYESECCGTNLCNARDMPEIPLNNTKNGLRCFTCLGDNCATAMDCLGDENNCIKSKVVTDGYTLSLKGCASESLCGMPATQPQVSLPNIYISSVCCRGSLCNHAERSGLALFLILVVLSSGILSL